MVAHRVSHSSVFKYLLLLTLTLNTSFTVLLLRASKFSVGNDGRIYQSSTAIFMAEAVKFLTCFSVLTWKEGLMPSFWHFYSEVILKWRETAKLLIPASLYMVQNNLLFIAVQYVDPATYQITYQMKILTTALCMACMLKKRLRGNQWIALVILTLGVALVQLENLHGGKSSPSLNLESSGVDNNAGTVYGLIFIGIACFSSGISGVYYEKLVKTGAQQSVITRNLQLTFLSLPLTFLAVFASQDTRSDIKEFGFFQGYGPLTWIVILFQALGGLLVAVVVKYTDNILKGFATSVSIVICTVFSLLTEDNMTVGPKFLIGTTLVISSSIMYNAAGMAAAEAENSPKLLPFSQNREPPNGH
eukprot:TCALIF_06135-PA protein Name:"Similar to Slc35a3 UDP-N-acetylglucosamine transporter (Rattus norvegicus)" AED:0.10 eAED:0.10 QI:1/1/0.83/1/0.6/0.66/6/63/359